MIFWTTDVITPQLSKELFLTQKVVCCQVGRWNGTDYPHFDLRLSDVCNMNCISLFLDNDIMSFIDPVLEHVSRNDNSILRFIEMWNSRRRTELYQQYKSGEKLDVGIYDCIDLLSLLDENIVLIIRFSDSIKRYLKPLLDYTVSLTENIRVVVLYNEGIKGLGRIKHFPQAVLPELSEDIIIATCSDAIYCLTGKRTNHEDLKNFYLTSSSLKEFIGYVQASVLYQTAPSFNWHRKVQF